MIFDLKPVRGNRRELHDGRGRGIGARSTGGGGRCFLETNANRIDGLSKRSAHLRKAFARGLGRKATTLEAAAIARAATLTARAEAAANDPDITLNDVVRADNAAQRARAAMAALIAKPKPSARDAVPSLAELINR
jgi:hypothetical protein